MSNSIDRLSSALSGRYEIERELGAGGMATVYLARDVKHDRQVAVKVLRPELAAVIGAERFLNEIKVTANLQHPHILPLHDSGDADGFLFYVMPYVEGESLRDKLNREKQLAIDEAITITEAVAGALDYAHRHDVIHRDIKPENILLHDGQALVADFGIALAVRQAGGTRLTETGLSIGTPQYMSPEQAMGDRELDARSDVYSLSAMLYEMLAGDPPYTGSTAQAILAKVITEKAPPVTAARDTVPGHVAATIQKALEKLPADRFHSAAEFAEALTHPGMAPVTSAAAEAAVGAPVTLRVPRWRTALPWGLLAATIAALVVQRVVPRPTELVQTMQFVERLPASVEGEITGVALANDGSRLVIPLARGGFLVRDLAESDGRFLLPGAMIYAPFLSPDGRWIAFLDPAERQLRRVSIDGGVSIPIADGVPILMGGSWGSDNTIVYVPDVSAGLWTVAAEGGMPEQITVPDRAAGELGHWYPQILPGGEKVLFSTYRTPLDSSAIEVVDLDTQQRDVLFKGGHDGRYVPTGHIVYMRRETMWAVPFDLNRMQVTGPGEPVLDGVAYSPDGAKKGEYTIADNGTLAYIKASDWNIEGRLVWVDRDGTERPVSDEWGVYDQPKVSPDGGRVAYRRIQGGEPDIWVDDPALGGIPTRVTRNDGVVLVPVWTRDGTDIIYSKEQPQFDLFRRDWRAGAQAEEFSASLFGKIARSVSPDGLELAYTVIADGFDIWILRLEGPTEPREFRASEHNEFSPEFSPDGRWLAYVSDETGQNEIWLESYPDAARGRRQVSREGGAGPRWGAGGELFYRHDSRIMAVPIDLASGSPGIPSVALEGPYMPRGDNYDVSPDGRRFLMIKPRPGVEQRREVTIVLNWFEELKRKMGN